MQNYNWPNSVITHIVSLLSIAKYTVLKQLNSSHSIMIQYILWISIHPFKTHFVPAKHSFRTIYIFHLQLKCSRPLISLPGHWSNLEQKMVYFMILISEQHQAKFIKSYCKPTYQQDIYLNQTREIPLYRNMLNSVKFSSLTVLPVFISVSIKLLRTTHFQHIRYC